MLSGDFGFPWGIWMVVMAEQTETGALVAGRVKRPRKGAYKISKTMQVALEALASGAASNLREAGEISGLTERALQYAVAKENVRDWLRAHVRSTLALGQLPAARTMLGLLKSDNSMSQYRAAAWLMAVNGFAPPERPAIAVQTNVSVGYVVDLSGGSDLPRPAGGPVIEHEPREVIDPADRGAVE